MTALIRRFASLLLLSLIIAVPAASKPVAKKPVTHRTAPWNAETSDLEPDKSIVYGTLPNGLRYAIKHNERPQNQVIVRLVFDFGSAAEKDNEQGLAHFIEHMVFNGSANVPEGEMVKMLERLGLSFGADTNASTGYTVTQYKLDLPKADPALIERALFLMRETASEVSFKPKAVDAERGVVIAEMRQRENYAYQSQRALNALLYPNSYFSDRYPIGKKKILETAPAARLKALYAKWYRPDRARLIIVGPVDPVAMEREIAAKFASWKKPKSKPLGDIDVCTFDPGRTSTAAIFTHPQVGENIQVQQLLADKKRPDNFDRALLEHKMSIAASIIAQRITRRSRAEDIPYLGGSLGFSTNLCDKYARIGFSASGKDGSWQALMPFMEQISRQAADYGFTPMEVDEQLKRLDTAYANAAKAEATRDSGSIAADLVGADDDIVSSAAYQEKLWKERLRPLLTPDSILAEFQNWEAQIAHPLVFLASKDAKGADQAALLAAFDASRKIEIAAPPARNDAAFAYTDFGPAGTVVEDKTIDDLGIRTIRFANGVLLNLKKTDFEDNRIRYSIRVDGGELAFGKDKALLSQLMGSAYTSGGLEAHDYDDLRSLLAGTTVAPGLSVDDDYFGSYGAVSPDDLTLQMQVIAAYMMHPGYRESAIRLFRRPLPEDYATLDATPGSALSYAAAKLMNDGDPRFALQPEAAVEALDFDQLKAGLGDKLLRNRLEIGMVGDIDETAAIEAVARTLGAMPARVTTPANLDAARQFTWSAKRGTFEVPHKGEANQLGWRRTWLTTDNKDQKTSQGMDLLARVITIRLTDELREHLGATYGGSASSTMSDIYPGRGTFSINTNADPKDLAAIETTVDNIIAEILAAPVSQDLFERARKPVLESYADWRKRNPTWMGVAAQAQTRPDLLDRFRNNEASFRTITPADLQALAQRFLSKQADYTFRALPDAMTGKSGTAVLKVAP